MFVYFSWFTFSNGDNWHYQSNQPRRKMLSRPDFDDSVSRRTANSKCHNGCMTSGRAMREAICLWLVILKPVDLTRPLLLHMFPLPSISCHLSFGQPEIIEAHHIPISSWVLGRSALWSTAPRHAPQRTRWSLRCQLVGTAKRIWSRSWSGTRILIHWTNHESIPLEFSSQGLQTATLYGHILNMQWIT